MNEGQATVTTPLYRIAYKKATITHTRHFERIGNAVSFSVQYSRSHMILAIDLATVKKEPSRTLKSIFYIFIKFAR